MRVTSERVGQSCKHGRVHTAGTRNSILDFGREDLRSRNTDLCRNLSIFLQRSAKMPRIRRNWDGLGNLLLEFHKVAFYNSYNLWSLHRNTALNYMSAARVKLKARLNHWTTFTLHSGDRSGAIDSAVSLQKQNEELKALLDQYLSSRVNDELQVRFWISLWKITDKSHVKLTKIKHRRERETLAFPVDIPGRHAPAYRSVQWK